MTLSITDALAAETFFKFSVGVTGTITSAQLITLQAHIASDLDNFIGNRSVTADLRTRIEACFILDRWFNRGGKGPITEESVKDNRWKTQLKTSSPYMDSAYSYLEKADLKVSDSDFTSVGSGVVSDDAYYVQTRPLTSEERGYLQERGY
jgi:hypothetical protein